MNGEPEIETVGGVHVKWLRPEFKGRDYAEFWSIRDIAAHTQRSPNATYQWRRMGGFPAPVMETRSVRTPGRWRQRFDPAEILQHAAGLVHRNGLGPLQQLAEDEAYIANADKVLAELQERMDLIRLEKARAAERIAQVRKVIRER